MKIRVKLFAVPKQLAEREEVEIEVARLSEWGPVNKVVITLVVEVRP